MDDRIGRKTFDTNLALVWSQHIYVYIHMCTLQKMQYKFIWSKRKNCWNIWSKASCARERWRNASPCSTVVERGDRRALVLATGDLRRWRNLIIARLDSHSLTCNSKWPALTTPCWVLGGKLEWWRVSKRGRERGKRGDCYLIFWLVGRSFDIALINWPESFIFWAKPDHNTGGKGVGRLSEKSIVWRPKATNRNSCMLQLSLNSSFTRAQ